MKVCSVVCFEDEGQILSSANDIKERNTEDFEDSNILTFYVTEIRYLFKRFKKDLFLLKMPIILFMLGFLNNDIIFVEIMTNHDYYYFFFNFKIHDQILTSARLIYKR